MEPSALPGRSTARPAPRPQACPKEDEREPDGSNENDHRPELAQVVISRLRQRHQAGEDDPRTAGEFPATYQQADGERQCDEEEQQPQDQEERVHRAATPRASSPPPHPKYRGRGGLFQAPGCARYSLAASGEGSNSMGTGDHAAVLDFTQIDATQVAVVGGKGAHLGELSRIAGVRVPPGFCVTANAF